MSIRRAVHKQRRYVHQLITDNLGVTSVVGKGVEKSKRRVGFGELVEFIRIQCERAVNVRANIIVENFD